MATRLLSVSVALLTVTALTRSSLTSKGQPAGEGVGGQGVESDEKVVPLICASRRDLRENTISIGLD